MKNITNASVFIWQYGFCLVLFFSGILQAQTQEKTVTGIVTTDSIPLMGVSITIKDTDKGVITDIDGAYKIQVQPGDILIYSHLGYEERSIQFLNQKKIDIELQLDATALGTVEITGGYYSLDERTRTGNVTKIDRTQLDQQVIHAPLEALQGRVAGLEVTSLTGMRGQAPQIVLRGQSSVRGIPVDKPLYIVDGVPIDNERLENPSSLFEGSMGIDPLSALDPSLIESIEVLKDADATAIYGSRGANGVIIINTKRGQPGKTKLEIQAETGASWVGHFMDLMNTEQYLEMRREAFANDGMEPTEANAPDLLLWDQNKYTDWQKELIGHHAEFQKYQGTLSGGNQQTSFLLSGGFQKESTVFPGDFGFQSNNLLANINHQSLDNRLMINSSINYGYQKSRLFDVGVFVNNVVMLSPNTPDLFDKNDSINWELDEFGNPTFSNPMAGLANPNVMKVQNLQWNGNVEYKLSRGLIAKVNMGFNQLEQQMNKLSFKKNGNPIYAATARSYTYKRVSRRNEILIEPQIHYKSIINQHEINSLIGATFQKNEATNQYFIGEGYFSESQVGNLALAEGKNVAQDDVIDYRYAAIFGRIGYSYAGKYHFNLTGRRDGSSRFGKKNRFGNFGAVGAAWDFYKEGGINSLSWLSYGKIRGSFGLTGSDNIGNYQYLDTYSNAFVYPNSLSSGGLIPSKLNNPFYHWEKNTKMELSLNIGLWNDMLLFSTSWYKERSGNQLVNISLPNIAGFTSIVGNFPATVQNTGLEIVMEATPIQATNFKWVSTANMTIPKNKLVSFPDIESSSYASLYEVGKPLGIKKLYHYTGIDSDTGKYTFEDANEDGVLNNDDKIVTVDLSRKFYGGWNNNIQYKNWNLSFLFEFVKQKGMNYYPSFGSPGIQANAPIEVLDRWQASNPNGSFQGYTQNYDAGFYNYASSDAMVIDASFVRLKSLSLNYSLPSKFLKSLHIQQSNIYLKTQNLLTFTSYKGYDPQNTGGMELPALTTFSLGLKLTI